MKILIVSWYFPPANTMGALRVGRLAEHLLGQGHDVRVLSASEPGPRETLDTTFPEDRVVRTHWWDINAPPRVAAKIRNRLRRGSGVPPTSAQTPAPANVSDGGASAAGGGVLHGLSDLYVNLTNWPDESMGWRSSAVRAGRQMIADDRPDLILASGPPFTTLTVGRALAASSSVPWVAEFRDRWWDDPYYQTSRMRTWGERIYERRLLRDVAGIVTVSRPWSESYSERYGKPTLTVFNGYEQANLADESPGADDIPQLLILYTGIIYPGRRDPTPLFKAMRMNDNAGDMRVQFYGCSPDHVMPLARQQEVDHLVEVRPPVPYREAVQLQPRADVLLLLQWDNAGEQGNVPGKLFEYLAARRPILAHGYTEGVPAQIIRERGAGLYSNNPEQIARQLDEWIATKRASGGVPALPASVHQGFSRAEQFSALEEFLSKAIANSQSSSVVRSVGNASAPSPS